MHAQQALNRAVTSCPRRLVAALLLLALAQAVPAQAASLFIEDLTWTEVRQALQRGVTTAIYYAGSTEQNGPHMALGKHNVIARHVAGRIAEKLGDALVYPVMPFAPTGDPQKKTDHMQYPGTVSVSEATYAAVAGEVTVSAIAAGFRTVVLMGDHGGGQDALKQLAAALDARYRAQGARVIYVPDVYFRSADLAADYLKRRGLDPGRHAALQDTAELMALDRDQQWIRPQAMAAGKPGSGVDGDPRSANAELGRVLLDFKIDSAVAQIRRLRGR
jgi:creatinine amidohydrolase